MIRERWAFKEGKAGKRPVAGKNYDDPGVQVKEDGEFVIQTGVSFDLNVRFLENGPNMTVEVGDNRTAYEKEVTLKGFTADDTCADVIQRISEVENLPIEDIRLFCPPHQLAPHVKIGQCYVNWNGFGMFDWPPRYVVKRAVKGFEILVHVPKMRDTCESETYALDDRDNPINDFADKHLIFDVTAATTVRELKALVSSHILMPVEIMQFWTQMKASEISPPAHIEMEDDDAPIGDYTIGPCSIVQLLKKYFDKEGRYIFDDEYWEADARGIPKLHPRPKWSTIKGNCTTMYGAKDPSTWAPDYKR